MLKPCASCGADFVGQSTAKYCSDRCRQRGRRGHLAVAATDPAAVPPPVLGGHPGLVAAVRGELVEAEALGSGLGQTVLVLAGRIESGQDTGAGLAALVREMRAVLEEIKTMSAAQSVSRLDEMRARRDAKRGN